VPTYAVTQQAVELGQLLAPVQESLQPILVLWLVVDTLQGARFALSQHDQPSLIQRRKHRFPPIPGNSRCTGPS
jgi:hypothetical protein